MKQDRIQVIPTLLLAAGEKSRTIMDSFRQQFIKKVGEDCCIAFKEIDKLSQAGEYLKGPFPESISRIFKKLSRGHDRYQQHHDWLSDGLDAKVILIADRSWLEDQKNNNNRSISADMERHVALVVFEDKEEYEDGNFEALFDWVAGLEWIGNCWWIDNQTQNMKLSLKEREKQAISWLHSLTWDKVAGYFLGSEQIINRSLPGSMPQIIGSFRISDDLDLEKDDLAKMLCVLYADKFMSPEEERNKDDQIPEISKVVDPIKSAASEGTIDTLKQKLKDTIRDIFMLKGRLSKIELLGKVVDELGKKAASLEFVQDMDFIDIERKHFEKTLEKFRPPSPKPVGGSIIITPKKNLWWLWLLVVALAILGAVIFLWSSEAFSASCQFSNSSRLPFSTISFLFCVGMLGLEAQTKHLWQFNSKLSPWRSSMLWGVMASLMWIGLIFSLPTVSLDLMPSEWKLLGFLGGLCLGLNSGLFSWQYQKRDPMLCEKKGKAGILLKIIRNPIVLGFLCGVAYYLWYSVLPNTIKTLTSCPWNFSIWSWRLLIIPCLSVGAQAALIAYIYGLKRIDTEREKEEKNNKIHQLTQSVEDLRMREKGASEEGKPISDRQKYEKVDMDLTQKVVLLRNTQDVLQDYLNHLTYEQADLLPEELKRLRLLFEYVDQDRLDGWLSHFEDKFNEWIDEFSNLIEDYPNLPDLYPRWLNKIVSDKINRDEIMDESLIKDVIAELTRHLSKLEQTPELLWRIDNYYENRCIIEIGIQIPDDALEDLDKGIHVSSVIPNKVKLIHFGQYIGG